MSDDYKALIEKAKTEIQNWNLEAWGGVGDLLSISHENDVMGWLSDLTDAVESLNVKAEHWADIAEESQMEAAELRARLTEAGIDLRPPRNPNLP